MCLAMPMKISKIDGALAQCEAGGLTQDIRIDFITDAQPGDYVMVHAGFAIEKMSEKEALENMELLEDGRNIKRIRFWEEEKSGLVLMYRSFWKRTQGNVPCLKCGFHGGQEGQSAIRKVAMEFTGKIR